MTDKEYAAVIYHEIFQNETAHTKDDDGVYAHGTGNASRSRRARSAFTARVSWPGNSAAGVPFRREYGKICSPSGLSF